MSARLAVPTLSIALASILWIVMGGAAVVNYDSLYALLWGTQLAAGHAPELSVAGAPTPHPLLTFAGLIGAPVLGSASQTALAIIAGVGYAATASCAVLLGLIAKRSFGVAAAVVAALLLVTREPVLSYGLRAYIDLPYLAFLLCALTLELGRSRRGAPVLWMLLLAGLLRPEAWLLSFAYLAWLWMGDDQPAARVKRQWILLAIAAPVLWLLCDLILTGDLLFSFQGTRAGAERLDRPTGVSGLVTIAPRRIGEVLRWEVLIGAAFGALLIARSGSRKGRLLGVVTLAAALAFAIVAIGGLPVIVRYLLPLAAMGCLACAYFLTEWRSEPSIPIGRVWAAGAALLLVAMLALVPAQWNRLIKLHSALLIQEQSVNELRYLTSRAPCGPIAVPNRRAVPLVALWTDRPAAAVVTTQDHPVPLRGSYLYPASAAAANDFILDARDRNRRIPPPPPGYRSLERTQQWILASSCR